MSNKRLKNYDSKESAMNSAPDFGPKHSVTLKWEGGPEDTRGIEATFRTQAPEKNNPGAYGNCRQESS